MGTPMTLPAGFGVRPGAAATPLLAFLAGEHAGAIARIWPAPHEGFLALPSARRHAAAILASRAAYPASQLEWMVSRARDGDLSAELFGTSPPGGLMKSLGRIGEVAWRAEDYARLLDLFGEAAACTLIRHMKALQPEALGTIAVLPPPLRQASIVIHLGADEAAARDLAAAWAMARRVRPSELPDAAQRLGRAASKGALFGMAVDVVRPAYLGSVRQVPVLASPFEAVRRTDVLDRFALEMRNCLRDFVADLADGRMAVFVWRGEGGPAAVALRQDAAGWRLAEARGRDNIELPDAALREIAAGVEAAGVRTGESWGALVRRLGDRAFAAEAGAQAAIAPGWRDMLALGNLWD